MCFGFQYTGCWICVGVGVGMPGFSIRVKNALGKWWRSLFQLRCKKLRSFAIVVERRRGGLVFELLVVVVVAVVGDGGGLTITSAAKRTDCVDLLALVVARMLGRSLLWWWWDDDDDDEEEDRRITTISGTSRSIASWSCCCIRLFSSIIACSSSKVSLCRSGCVGRFLGRGRRCCCCCDCIKGSMLLLDNVNVDDMEMENEKKKEKGKRKVLFAFTMKPTICCALRIILPHNPDDRRIQWETTDRRPTLASRLMFVCCANAFHHPPKNHLFPIYIAVVLVSLAQKIWGISFISKKVSMLCM